MPQQVRGDRLGDACLFEVWMQQVPHDLSLGRLIVIGEAEFGNLAARSRSHQTYISTLA